MWFVFLSVPCILPNDCFDYSHLQICPEFVLKRCDEDGLWEGRGGKSRERDSPSGWTNYTPCLTPEILELYLKLYSDEKLAAVRINYTRALSYYIRVYTHPVMVNAKSAKVCLT